MGLDIPFLQYFPTLRHTREVIAWMDEPPHAWSCQKRSNSRTKRLQRFPSSQLLQRFPPTELSQLPFPTPPTHSTNPLSYLVFLCNRPTGHLHFMQAEARKRR